ncbi:MAG: DUF2752 domain-containing protein [Deltaproteobacteria bacterium]|nr:DUF2752 domain-containing protein [Deltaproteobacteria bacterium]
MLVWAALTVIGVCGANGICSTLFQYDIMACLPDVSLCPFHVLTGRQCPGCGMTRALLSLGQLDIQQALRHNPLALPLAIVMLLYIVNRKLLVPLNRRSIHTILLVTVLLFWTTRLLKGP